MILVHDIFVCKPGNASKLAKLFKEIMTMHTNPELVNILTDMTGQYNRVIMVSQYDSLAAYEEAFKKYMNPTPEMQEAMKKMDGYTDLYLSGSREIYKIW